MKIAKSKTMATLIAALLIFSMTASMMLIPTASAHTPPWHIATYAYINAEPNPVGVGQSVEVIMWLNWVMGGAALSNNYRFHNYQLTITEPNGTVLTVPFPVVSDPTSAQDYHFTPTKTGTYVLDFSFPGQNYTFTMSSAYYGDTYEPSSASTNLTVQQASIAAIPATPLPTAYWTRPIYGENTNWFTISSNWLGNGAPGYQGFGSSYNGGGNGEQLSGAGDVVGSLTSHIMWTKPLDSGGVVGGNQTVIQGDTYFEGSAYNQRYENPIIVDGMLIYTEPISFAGTPASNSFSAYGPVVCVNLQTGQQIWSSPGMPAPSFAYIYDVQDPNQHGVYQPILFASVITGFNFVTFTLLVEWRAFDAFTGDPMFNVTNIPSGTTILGSNGEHLIISLVNYGTPTKPNYYLQEWNSSRLWESQYNGASTSLSVVPPVTNGAWAGGYTTVMTPFGPFRTYEPSLFDWNVSVPYMNTAGPITEVGAINNDLLLCYGGTLPGSGAFLMSTQSDTPYTYFAVDIDQSTPSALGSILWHETLSPPSGNITVLEAGIDPVNRVFVEDYRETQQYVGYSLDTGKQLWGPTTPQVSLDYYGSLGSGSLANAFAYGKMYSSAYGGIVYCYDTKTGDILWTYGNGGAGNSTNSGLETPFGHYPTFINAIGNDVVYTVTTEHTVETPIFKGAVASAINATTGELIWSLSDYTGEFGSFSYAAADGYSTWFNGYDAQIYVVGRGPSATTVTAPNIGVTTATPVVIRGTVTDVSAGTKQNEQAADFPNGVPCASDASMSAWMSYVYQQQPEPTDFTGVPVTVSVTDSNHNHYVIGTATTDESGFYTLTWTPIISGNYTVYANFAGTNGYWPSSAETSFYAGTPPPTASPYPTPVTGLASTGTVELGIAAVIIVIVIIGVVLAILTLRKRP